MKTDAARTIERIRKKIIQHRPSNVYASAKLGRNVSIGTFAEVGHNVEIGDGSRIGANAFIPEGVTIGKNVFVSPSCVFCNDRFPRVGGSRQKWEKTVVKDDASLGANCTIMCGVTIGKGAIVGAGSVVLKDVPAFEIHAGNPAKKIGIV